MTAKTVSRKAKPENRPVYENGLERTWAQVRLQSNPATGLVTLLDYLCSGTQPLRQLMEAGAEYAFIADLADYIMRWEHERLDARLQAQERFISHWARHDLLGEDCCSATPDSPLWDEDDD